jgi:hypothetical protein
MMNPDESRRRKLEAAHLAQMERTLASRVVCSDRIFDLQLACESLAVPVATFERFAESIDRIEHLVRLLRSAALAAEIEHGRLRSLESRL